MPQVTPYSSKHISERRLTLSIPRWLLEWNVPSRMQALPKQRYQAVKPKEARCHPLNRKV
ncbi:hypothetical protein [Ktedonobacter racemifer]|uniref:hypothetical protein n=1 Tax=Ktedonobacter racemifer TaxID=363277 RepID=UPI0002E6A03C|nr:hypothetical protein [Ktedonobacter racemifer]